ncbi:MAG: CDP-diacylglycerol--glycerol-3-phosphate 3-phosphatidyltransferase [Gammaproteobacteria bacterium]|nr:CDP-diacylglycerol--glycerol-3-phosphate 3-phosphatidyltransferase [Gammaproteobacteria bacterium]MDX2486191.1 CDP-diacylglycerol--glycerol-3-phosphate 3-phosphatidyltransferase [Gammaproteobacteria bacterium]
MRFFIVTVPLNIPNLLTLLRILLIPFFFVVYVLDAEWSNQVATFIFVVAAVTDWLDGYMARRLNQYTAFGAFLDPVADKLIVATALVLLATDEKVLDLVYSVPLFAASVSIIIGREIVISALREWMAELGKRASVAVSYIGKVKTTLQLIAISLLIYQEPLFGLPIFKLGEILLFIAAALTLYSMFVYLKAAWPVLTEQE